MQLLSIACLGLLLLQASCLFVLANNYNNYDHHHHKTTVDPVPREPNDAAWRNINCPQLLHFSGDDYVCHYHPAYKSLAKQARDDIPVGGVFLISQGQGACFVLLCAITEGPTFTLGNPADTDTKVELDSLSNLMSANKIATQVLFMHYGSTGRVNFADKWRKYWPTFGFDRNGQSTGYENITIQQVLEYKAAMGVLGRALTLDDVRTPGSLSNWAKLRASVQAAAPTTENTHSTNPLDIAQYPQGNGVAIGGVTAYSPTAALTAMDFFVEKVDPNGRSAFDVLTSSEWAEAIGDIMHRPGDNLPDALENAEYEFYAHGVASNDEATLSRMLFPQKWTNPNGGPTPGDIQYGTELYASLSDPNAFGCSNSSTSSVTYPAVANTVAALALLRPEAYGVLPAFGLCGITDTYGLGGAHHTSALTLWAYAALLTYRGGVPGSRTRLAKSSVVAAQMAQSTDGTVPDGYFHTYCRAYGKGVGYKAPSYDSTHCGVSLTDSGNYGDSTYAATWIADPDAQLTMVAIPQGYADSKTPFHALDPAVEAILASAQEITAALPYPVEDARWYPHGSWLQGWASYWSSLWE